MNGRGYILLTIKNDLPNTTTITEGNLITQPLYENDLRNGSWTRTYTMTAEQPGHIQIEAGIDASHLAEAGPITIANEGPLAQVKISNRLGCCQHYHGFGGRFCEEMKNDAACFTEFGDDYFEGKKCGPDGRCK